MAVVDLDADRAGEAAGTLDGAIGIGADVSDDDAVREAVASAAEHLGGLDGVVNAGGHAKFGRVEDWDWADWQMMMNVHVGGTFLVTKYAAQHLRRSDNASIVNVASVAAFVAQPLNAPYGAAKAAITGFTRQSALDLGQDGIRVNCVAPGRIETAMMAPIILERGDGDPARGREVLSRFSILKRLGQPREIAEPVCFLLSEESSFITGHTMPIDGGELAL
ncbi:hypothetical protein A6035_13920 [Dietzia lutea]|uniref:Short-chain dehydrogenase n=1 Tax=Dietzia lutea TaxID=546160 RepID=A0A2S1R9X1_9ACTN|nr:hypothetical protein A6035_13920 [Dietzia lutea]